MSLLKASPSEQRLLQAAGEMVDLREGRPEADDPGRADDWGAERIVRAEFLREILSGARKSYCGPGARPVRLRGARITGILDLEGVGLVRSVLLQDCYFDEPVNLCEARALAVRLPGCHLPSLQARQLEVRGDLILNDGLAATSVNVAGAKISGVLNLNGATSVTRLG